MTHWVMGDLSLDVYAGESTEQRVIGGTGANIASMISRLGGDVGLIATVGQDNEGEFLIQVLSHLGVRGEFVAAKKSGATSVVKVTVDSFGERTFELVTSKSQQSFVSSDDLPSFKKGDHLVISGVCLIAKEERSVVHQAIEQVNKLSGLTFYDANIREEQWESDRNEIIKSNLDVIDKVTVVKLSDEELLFLTGASDYNQAIKQAHLWDCQCVVITKGSQGCDFLQDGELISTHGVEARVVDTTGAGDAFSGTLSYLMTANHGEVSIGEMQRCLQVANYVGATVVAGKGAIEPQPTIEQIQKNFSHR
ncbi:carbohydrate kinase family protein [Photobacterium satsumensis]|uniref:carbohydrate kinase family protein n=1 Tax=Photobacterium satsumensis TaxID=2910239 RepID=UPI003D099D75